MIRLVSQYIRIIKLIVLASIILLPFNVYAGKVAKDTIRFADMSYDSIQVHNRIAAFIVKNGFGYDIQYVPGETIMLNTGLIQGDVDVNMESWTENIQEIYNKGTKSGKVLDLGSNFSDNWQGWLVPAYVVKGDPERGIEPMAPDLKSVSDLPRYWKLFKDPESPAKGRFNNGLPGWMLTKINSQKLKTYGLDQYYNDFITGSGAALSGSIVAAYKRGKPWLGYYWEPTWVLGKYDMYRLEEPPFDQKVWDTTKGCAYKATQVNILVTRSMLERAPDVVDFLKKYETTTAQANEFLSYMQDSKGSTEDAAVWFLKKYESLWSSWVPEDAAKKIKAALP